jgi:hypothetical protein
MAALTLQRRFGDALQLGSLVKGMESDDRSS